MHMWDVGRGRDASLVHSLASVLQGREGSGNLAGKGLDCSGGMVGMESP